jgi:hypothetical protein
MDLHTYKAQIFHKLFLLHTIYFEKFFCNKKIENCIAIWKTMDLTTKVLAWG